MSHQRQKHWKWTRTFKTGTIFNGSDTWITCKICRFFLFLTVLYSLFLSLNLRIAAAYELLNNSSGFQSTRTFPPAQYRAMIFALLILAILREPIASVHIPGSSGWLNIKRFVSLLRVGYGVPSSSQSYTTLPVSQAAGRLDSSVLAIARRHIMSLLNINWDSAGSFFELNKTLRLLCFTI